MIVILSASFYCPLDYVEGFQPEEDKEEKEADDTPSEDEEKSDDMAPINQDDDEQPEDNDDANSKKETCVLYSKILFTGRAGTTFPKTPTYF